MNRISKLPLIVILAIIITAAQGCGKREKVLVRMRGGDITRSVFQNEIMKVSENPYYQGFLSTVGGKRQYLEGLIEEKIIVIQAKKEELHKRKEYRERVKEMKDQVLISFMMEELRKELLSVSDKEINDYYENQKEEFLNPEQVKTSHILLSTRQDAEGVMEKLKGGEKFKDLTKQYSIDSMTAARDGDLGYFSRGDMVPEFEQAVFKLKNIGDITDIIKTQFGYHIVKLTGRKKTGEKSVTEAKDEISKLIQRNKYNNIMEQYKRELRVDVDEELLEDISVFDEEMSKKEENLEGEENEKKK